MKTMYADRPKAGNAEERKMQSGLEAMHSANNAFVKKMQASKVQYAGGKGSVPQEAEQLNSYMMSPGFKAAETASKVGKKMDQSAFPVK